MTRSEGVVLTLTARGEAGQPARLSQSVKIPAPAGEYLVNVALMTHVENNSVLGRVKNSVYSQGKLHRTEIGCQMTA